MRKALDYAQKIQFGRNRNEDGTFASERGRRGRPPRK